MSVPGACFLRLLWPFAVLPQPSLAWTFLEQKVSRGSMLSSLPSCPTGPDLMTYMRFISILVRQDYLQFTGGETEAQTSPVSGRGTHLTSVGAEFTPCLPGAHPMLINHIISIIVSMGLACWRDTCHHPTTDIHPPISPNRRNKDTFLPFISHHPGPQADPRSFPSDIPCFFPPQGTVPPPPEMCLLSLCSSLTPNFAFGYGVRDHTLTQVGRLHSHHTYL